MTVKLVLSELLLGVLLVSYAKAGVIQISAYGNVFRQGASPLRNNSDASAGTDQAMNSGFNRNSVDGLSMKPVNYGTMTFQNSFIEPAVASDRFTPGEAYGGTVFKILKAKHGKRKGYQYQKPNDASLDDTKTNPSSPAPASPPPSPTAAVVTVPVIPAPITPSPLHNLIAGPTPLPETTSEKNSLAIQYIPSSDPNLFAPNIHSHYPPPPANGKTRFNGVTSYLPPAAGPVADDASVDSNHPDSPPSNQYIPPADLFQFPPNIHSHYNPPPMGNNFYTNGLTSYLPPPAGPTDIYLSPSSVMSADSSTSDPPSSPDSSDDLVGTIPIHPDSPYPAYLPPSGSQGPVTPAPIPQYMMMAMPPAQNMMMSMPLGPLMSGPPMDIPFGFHGYKYNHPHDHFPEYFFDHDYPHDHHDKPPSTTTPEPPPPPPAKVKNYNYYYISRVFWYFPLYFTLYFAIYIVVLILRSLARYKIGYPNHLSGVVPPANWDKIVTRSLDDMQFLTQEQAALKADIMAQFVMKQIDDFKEKYIG
ncbi:uncharacterized protein LOC135708099 [Ochlerotatus camptorhynchus]|uniref:uncharacterized protein LOC135708099 n=1 Tax=Ochlerotatus camptorhynchus TaxID=644619 RepID=UPI0031E143E1